MLDATVRTSNSATRQSLSWWQAERTFFVSCLRMTLSSETNPAVLHRRQQSGSHRRHPRKIRELERQQRQGPRDGNSTSAATWPNLRVKICELAIGLYPSGGRPQAA